MPKLRCIRGPWDGKFADFDKRQMQQELTNPPGTVDHQTNTGMSSGRPTSTTTYVVHTVTFSGIAARFATPEGWTARQAIKHLFVS